MGRPSALAVSRPRRSAGDLPSISEWLTSPGLSIDRELYSPRPLALGLEGSQVRQLRKKRLSAQAQDNAVVRPITFTHCTPPMFEELAHWVDLALQEFSHPADQASWSSYRRCIPGSGTTAQAQPSAPSIPRPRGVSICSCCCTRPVDGRANPLRASVAPSPLRTSSGLVLRKPITSDVSKTNTSQIEIASDSPVFDGQLDDSAIVLLLLWLWSVDDVKG